MSDSVPPFPPQNPANPLPQAPQVWDAPVDAPPTRPTSPGSYERPAYPQPVPFTTVQSNGYATAALVLGICGFVLMGIPFFIGIVLGGIPDLLAVAFGIAGISRASRPGVRGMGAAITGLVLAGVSLMSVLLGAGWLW
ncbi:DUF4190 domain-containing protein [Agreia sp. VKM Ac-1783]|uniref:DUF4190 domain-containing protein n=1 Tax=Agreia sp. VKM Ac-1783 TaxID=1938889 RepID=UPI000A2ADD0E|nr:DUF4190 domain-containing protein [Agreia sp. VKM Ac-1783]SMQ71671.1 hypothetical protein SAMN06295943_2573 [Agreia sp. VKM Ac-1783]